MYDDSDMSKLKAEVRKLQQLLEVANKELKDMHASYDKQVRIFDKNIELNEKEHMVNDLKKIIDDLSSELTKLQHDLRDSEEIVKARDFEIEDLKRQHSPLPTSQVTKALKLLNIKPKWMLYESN